MGSREKGQGQFLCDWILDPSTKNLVAWGLWGCVGGAGSFGAIRGLGGGYGRNVRFVGVWGEGRG
jgi:hypothetical protein